MKKNSLDSIQKGNREIARKLASHSKKGNVKMNQKTSSTFTYPPEAWGCRVEVDRKAGWQCTIHSPHGEFLTRLGSFGSEGIAANVAKTWVDGYLPTLHQEDEGFWQGMQDFILFALAELDAEEMYS